MFVQLSSKIIKEAYAQQREIENEENLDKLTFFEQAVYDFIDDVDETQSQLDYQVRLENINYEIVIGGKY